MDASSIITQVSRDEELSTNNERVTTAVKKSKRGFFQSLICCFRQKYDPSNNSAEKVVADTRIQTGQSTNGAVPLLSGNTAVAQSLRQEENGCGMPDGRYLLPAIRPQDAPKKCMVIDLDETLVHSSFKPICNADFIVPVEIDGTVHQVYVLKRPYVDEFLQRMGEIYECVLFTASLAKYADPVADLLDKWGVFRARLFRESCVFHRGNYVKDLGRLGRDLHKVLIVDNSPASYIFHPDNAVPVASWFDDLNDTELRDLIPFFERLAEVDNVYTVLRNPLQSMMQVQSISKEVNSLVMVGATS
ncbi:carboxy-terminal domain RNA polymerase II polypeptide A small phosphatase 1-like [Artemia franciscana]|uniref:protein-serine/threonine phosphatase n=1 Tax=Artemia franciscana TaxID=6661 RepID=A0AA88IEV0_ARTSF|nr:hypothetical protein QYM36_003261 [Artemia franciscana]KAK2723002.1 hypothetical protein QYM36_003261 [Artemia franciscana]